MMVKTPAQSLMRDSRLGWAFACAMLLFPLTASAQATMRPERRPVVTAENERWYLEGQPITYQGGLYYPAGAPVFFNGNEMATDRRLPRHPALRARHADSVGVVYVPVAGGLVRPYERRRDGEVAGTVGNAAPSFPVSRDIETTLPDAGYQAAAPPVLGAAYLLADSSRSPSFRSARGVRRPPARPAAASRQRPAGPLTTALKPTGLNAFYIEYSGNAVLQRRTGRDLEPACVYPRRRVPRLSRLHGPQSRRDDLRRGGQRGARAALALLDPQALMTGRR